MKRFCLLTVFLISSAFAKDIDATLAIVNDEVITQSDLDAAIAQESTFSHKQNFSKKQVLNFLIDESVLVQQAKLMKIEVSSEELSGIFASFLQNNNQTEESLKKLLSAQGQTIAEFKDKLKRQVLAMRVQSNLMTPNQRPTIADINKYYEQHKADGLMVAFDDRVFTNTIPKDWKKSKVTKISMTYLKGLPQPYQTELAKQPFQKEYGPITTENGHHMVTSATWQGELMPKGYVANRLMMQAIEKHRSKIVASVKKNMYVKVFN